MQTAQFWQSLDDSAVRCLLCPHHCVIAPGKTGICTVRKNHEGSLISLNYMVVSGNGIDPIEKKPLFHFFPGSQILSFGTFGCNLSCNCCQNYTISKEFPVSRLASPNLSVEEVTRSLTQLSDKYSLAEFCGLAYTYTEPTVWAETVLALSPVVRSLGLKNVFVTNGFISREPLDAFLEYADACNIDLKAFDNDVYRSYFGGELQPVLDTIATAAQRTHVEITMLIIPTVNDSEDQLFRMRDWIAKEVGPNTPVHLSRYFPTYKATLPPTPLSTLSRAYDILNEKLPYVYIGNTGQEQDTICASCQQHVIIRHGYTTTTPGLSPTGTCTACGATIAKCS
jgi:pyruvate formate lyase activating enzyme